MAQESLIGFTRYTKPDYRPAGHHKLIADALERVESGECKRLMIFMPPRHGKSELASRRFPAWFLGRNPDRSVIAASYNSDLADDFGREVRDIFASRLFGNVFETRLAANSKASGRWHTSGRGGYVAAGVGTAVTGRGAHVLLIDDPFKDRVEADSEVTREKVWRWYTSTAYTRLEGDVAAEILEDDDIWNDFLQDIAVGDAEPFEGAIVLIMCMTGDTPVMMSNGTEKPLRAVQIGDEIATYEDGRLTTSKVLNWKNQGPDSVFEIRTTSGRIVKANERHPFLVERDGKQEWIRLRDLRIGDAMLSVKERGQARPAPMPGATMAQKQKASATITTKKSDGPVDIAPHPRSTRRSGETLSFDIAMELALLSTTPCSLNSAAYVQYASGEPQKAPLSIGAKPSASIIVTTPAPSEACSATTATSLWAEDETSNSCNGPLSTYSVARDIILSILPCGREDVFDIQVERTENFIANGLVSHNTRWNEDDLGGRLLAAQKTGGDQWEVLDLPALNDEGQALWPEKYSAERLGRIRAAIGPRDWSALYQQRPSPDEGTFFQREWFKRHASKPVDFNVYITSDYAVSEGKGDYTEHGVWGLDADNRLFMLDWWSGQKTSDVWIEKLLDLIKEWSPLCVFGESGVIEKAIRPQLDRRMMERQIYSRMEWLPSITDKATRARAFQARASMGLVSLPTTEEGERVLSQLLSFPAGKYDDAVDACSLMGMAIDQAHSAIVKPASSGGGKANDYGSAPSGGASWRL